MAMDGELMQKVKALSLFILLVSTSAPLFAQLPEEADLETKQEELLDQELGEPQEAPYPGAPDSEFAESPEIPLSEPPASDMEAPPVFSPAYEAATEIQAHPLDTKKAGSEWIQHPNAAKGLLKIEKDGTYIYRTKSSVKSQAASLRIGTLPPPSIEGAENLSYADFYGSTSLPLMSVEYEWSPFTSFGKLGLLTGIGFASTTGKGRFRRDLSEAEEGFTLLVFPLNLSIMYRFEYSSTQWFIPYLSGGGLYFGVAESRDDKDFPTLAGSLAVTGAGGILFSLNSIDRKSASSLDAEYGINNICIALDWRVVQSIKKTMDFSGNYLAAGFTFDF